MKTQLFWPGSKKQRAANISARLRAPMEARPSPLYILPTIFWTSYALTDRARDVCFYLDVVSRWEQVVWESCQSSLNSVFCVDRLDRCKWKILSADERCWWAICMSNHSWPKPTEPKRWTAFYVTLTTFGWQHLLHSGPMQRHTHSPSRMVTV